MDNNTGNGDKKDAKGNSTKDNRPEGTTATERATDKHAAAGADKNAKTTAGNKQNGQSKSQPPGVKQDNNGTITIGHYVIGKYFLIIDLI